MWILRVPPLSAGAGPRLPRLSGARRPDATMIKEDFMTFGGVVFLLVFAGLVVAIIVTYNKLVGLRQRFEEAIQSSRRYYNAVVRDFNTTIDSFPSNQIALFFRFVKRQYFELDRPEERQVPRVSFGS